jgi:hypothetical protein
VERNEQLRSAYRADQDTFIHPNYHPAYTYRQLYLDVAKAAVFDLDVGLNILRYITHTQDTLSDELPSWVPRWDVRLERATFALQEQYYDASGDLAHTSLSFLYSRLPAVCDAPLLQLRARCLGTVASTHIFTFTLELLDFFFTKQDYALSTWTEIVSNVIRFPELVAFALALGAGLMVDSQRYVRDAYQHLNRHLVDFNADVRRKELQKSLFDEADDSDSFAFHVEKALWRRAVFRTRDGRFGLGPRICRLDDEVWLPMGAEIPLVFRPGSVGMFKVLGQAYLQGMMSGEAVVGLSEDDFDEVILC